MKLAVRATVEEIGKDENGNTNTTVSVTRAGGTWSGGMDGTVNDATLDYDHDGLQNWQEYLVGTMRCWRLATFSCPGPVSSADVLSACGSVICA